MTKSLIAAIALCGMAALPTAALAEPTHGCACVHNKINTTINYRYKWGDGQWQSVKLPNNTRQSICWRYADAKKSPDLVFQLDVDMTKGSTWTTYAINRVQTTGATCEAVGKNGHYEISYRPNTNNSFIQITKQN